MLDAMASTGWQPPGLQARLPLADEKLTLTVQA